MEVLADALLPEVLLQTIHIVSILIELLIKLPEDIADTIDRVGKYPAGSYCNYNAEHSFLKVCWRDITKIN